MVTPTLRTAKTTGSAAPAPSLEERVFSFAQDSDANPRSPDSYGAVTGLSLGEVYGIAEGLNVRYRHVPFMNDREYLVNMRLGKGTVCVEYGDGEVTLHDFFAVYRIVALVGLEQSGLRVQLQNVTDRKEREEAMKAVHYQDDPSLVQE